MSTYGFNKKERDFIARKIEIWMQKNYPYDWDWTKSGITVTKEYVSNWQQGDIIDIQEDHIKIFVAHASTIAHAKSWGCEYYGRTGQYIIFKRKYFPDPDNNLIITDNNGWKMEIVSYDGALRIYKQLTGKKLEGFEDYGRDVYF